jgi:pyruvate ferredoxin oxidoreductase alpha subunit
LSETKTETSLKGVKNLAALTGNEAVAQALRQINPDVIAAYPITPATEIVQIFSTYVSDGLVNTEFVAVESEHSAMSATIGASAAGARAMTATSSQGLALMWEMLYIASGLRRPIVMPVVNRALSSPINIHCDHSDTMGARDAGWLHIFSEDAQEAYDNTIQAIRISEHPDIQLPTMVTMDGFIISHGMEVVKMLDDDVVRDFVGTYKPDTYLLDVDKPVTMGGLDFTDFYFEHRRQLAEPMEAAPGVVKQIGEEYGKLTGRKFGLYEGYMLDDADYVMVLLGSTAGTAKTIIPELRAKGIKAGLLKLRMFRPFPYDEVAGLLAGRKAVAVMDRSDGLAGLGGPVFGEIRSALYEAKQRPPLADYVYGLGGRDCGPAQLMQVFEDMQKMAVTGAAANRVNYLGVRE